MNLALSGWEWNLILRQKRRIMNAIHFFGNIQNIKEKFACVRLIYIIFNYRICPLTIAWNFWCFWQIYGKI